MLFHTRSTPAAFKPDSGRYPLPAMRLDMDDLRDIVADLTERNNRPHIVRGRHNREIDLDHLDEVSKHDLSLVTIRPESLADERDKEPLISVELDATPGKSYVFVRGEVESASAVGAHARILELARPRLNLRIFVWMTFATLAAALIVLPLWYLIAVGLDLRLTLPATAAIAATIYVAYTVAQRVDAGIRGYYAGVKILPYARKEERERVRNHQIRIKYSAAFGVTGFITGYLFRTFIG